MAILSKADILSVKDTRTVEVDLNDIWGGSVYVRTMTAAEKGRFEQRMVNKSLDYSTILAEYAVAIVVDEEGNCIFEPKDVKALADKNAAALQRIFDAGQNINNFTREDVEELAKN